MLFGFPSKTLEYFRVFCCKALYIQKTSNRLELKYLEQEKNEKKRSKIWFLRNALGKSCSSRLRVFKWTQYILIEELLFQSSLKYFLLTSIERKTKMNKIQNEVFFLLFSAEKDFSVILRNWGTLLKNYALIQQKQ